MAGARLLSAPDRHRIPAPLQIPTKTLKGEKIFSISDKDFPVTPVYFAHVLLTRMGLLKLLICHFTYFHAGGPREISRGPPRGVTAPSFFSRFFLLAQTNPLTPPTGGGAAAAPAELFSCLLPLSGQGLLGSGASRSSPGSFLASRRTRFGFSGRLWPAPRAAGPLNRSLCHSTPSHW